MINQGVCDSAAVKLLQGTDGKLKILECKIGRQVRAKRLIGGAHVIGGALDGCKMPCIKQNRIGARGERAVDT